MEGLLSTGPTPSSLYPPYVFPLCNEFLVFKFIVSTSYITWKKKQDHCSSSLNIYTYCFLSINLVLCQDRDLKIYTEECSPHLGYGVMITILHIWKVCKSIINSYQISMFTINNCVFRCLLFILQLHKK